MNPIDLQLLTQAAQEIRSLRRCNEILSAKVEMIDLFACVLHTKAVERQQGCSPDIAWELDKAVANATPIKP